MPAKAIVRHVRMSPRKMRIIANQVRGKSVGEAMSLLKVSPKKASVVIRKLLISAVTPSSSSTQSTRIERVFFA